MMENEVYFLEWLNSETGKWMRQCELSLPSDAEGALKRLYDDGAAVNKTAWRVTTYMLSAEQPVQMV